ncbi:MAG: golvesin C-terminal-like domain-containing protein [Bacteroidales bacterium]
MAFLHNINTVAHYEAKILRRTWFFRLFSIGALFILTIMNVGLFSPLGGESWELVSIPSSVPLINLYILNIGQAIVVIFLASDFMKRDKKLDTIEVLYTRSITNFEYVAGKTLGILRLFLSLNLVILLIGLIINIISSAMKVDIISYVEYLLIISLPTLLFSLGLAFILMLIIRNQAITFFLLLGYAALNLFYLWFRAGSVFDYMAFGLPVFKSGITGFGNSLFIINQRLIYFFLGSAFVMASVLMFKRLPQSRFQRQLALLLLLLSTAGAGITLYNTLKSYFESKNLKSHVIDINRIYEQKDFPSTISANIELVHKGQTIEANAELKFVNDNENPLSVYLFSLNPGLRVLKITSGDKDLPFKTNGHIIEIDPGKPLARGGCDSLKITYSGTVKESFCYPNYSDNIRENRYRIAMVNVNKRQAFLSDDYVLLTPEIHWYPVSGLNYYPSNPARIKIDFIEFELKAASEKNLKIVSQGLPEETEGFTKYSCGFPLTGLTVAMGNYLADRISADSVEFISWHYPGNDYYKNDFEELKDTLPRLISGFMRDLESGFGTAYPFHTFSILEAPVQFFSYPKKNTQTRAEVQPSLVILPEKLSTIQQAGFAKRIARQKKQMTRNNQVITDKELKVRIFNNFIRNTFISGQSFRTVNGVLVNEPTRYLLGPSFYFFRNNFYSDEYPVINAVFESHLQKLNQPAPQPVILMTGNLSDNDRANLILNNISFKELLEKNPGTDTLRSVLTLKGDYLFNLLRYKAGINEFNEWFKQYIERNSYKRINILKMNADIKEKFGFEFYPCMEEWFNGRAQPGFLFTNPEARQIVADQRTRYQVTFVASNPEPAGGLFNISFRTGGGFGGRGGGQMALGTVQGPGAGGVGGRMMQIAMQGRGMESADISKIIYLGPGEAKKIGIVLETQPRAMQINTLISKNIPGEISFTIEELTKASGKEKPFDGDELLSEMPSFAEPHEIIVDNEDKGFYRSSASDMNPLKKLLNVKKNNQIAYQSLNLFLAPEYWQPVIQNTGYGKYVRSSVYTRAGTGDRYISWKGIIKQPGYYDIYTFIGKAGERIMVRGQRGPAGSPPGRPASAPAGGPAGGPPPRGGETEERGRRAENPYKDFHFKVYHDDGVDEIVVDYESADPGWNKLGTYYLSPDTVKVELTNKSEGRVVIGDAVKWVIKE